MEKPWMKLDAGLVVMVTGASSGIGREICLDLGKAAGCCIVAAARRVDRLKSLCEEIGSSRGRAVAVELDVTADSGGIDAAVERAWDAFGRIDVLVNNAGVRGRVASSLSWSQEEWDNITRTNMSGLWLVSKHVCTRMNNAKIKGSVINISSVNGLPRSLFLGCLPYTASKAGVDAVTRLMSLELGAYNIRVNSIAPGLFKSEITQELLLKRWIKNVERKMVPLKTFGSTDPAITSLVRFLIHDSSKYITGNVFIIDAGLTLTGVPLYSSL